MAHEAVYWWEVTEPGDSSAPCVYQVTAERIAEYSRAARYENLVYTNQPAARETGLPGIIAPPAMTFAYAPLRLAGVAAARGCVLPEPMARHPWAAPLGTVAIQFQGAMVAPRDVITSVTTVLEKSGEGERRSITFQVTAHNQRGEVVAVYCYTCPWPSAADSV